MHIREHLLFLKNRELDEIFGHIAIRSFAGGMVGVFIPIYLLGLGHTVTMVFVYYIIRGLTHSFSAPACAHIAARFGYKHTMLLSLVPGVIFFILLQSGSSSPWVFVILAIMHGWSGVLLWTGYHADFTTWSKPEERDGAIGFATAGIRLTGALSPAIGGILIMNFGFPLVFAIVIILFILSGVPLILSKDTRHVVDFSLWEALKKRKPRAYLAMFGHSIHLSAAAVLWPLYLSVVVVLDFSSLGFVTSVSLISAALATVVIGFIAQKHHKFVLWASSILNSVLWIVKLGLTSLGLIYLVDALHGVARTAAHNSFDASNYEKASRRNILGTIMFREFVAPLGGVVFFAVLAVTESYTGGFVTAAAGSLLYLLY